MVKGRLLGAAHLYRRRGPVDLTTSRSRTSCSARSPSTASTTRPNEVQLCSLLSVKTGGCPEDCAYCPQSSHHETGVERRADDDARTRCSTAARARQGRRRHPLLHGRRLARGQGRPGLRRGAGDGARRARAGHGGLRARSACSPTTQAQPLAEAGLTAYNHNLDTSREFYKSIISTRTYDDRLRTLANVRKAGITVCSGGIIGMGESIDDRCGMLMTLANLDPQPESVPINALVAGRGHAARRAAARSIRWSSCA